MNKLWNNYGGLILFYGVIIMGVILLNQRFRYLNEMNLINGKNQFEYRELKGEM